jgi:hypothetical protein
MYANIGEGKTVRRQYLPRVELRSASCSAHRYVPPPQFLYTIDPRNSDDLADFGVKRRNRTETLILLPNKKPNAVPRVIHNIVLDERHLDLSGLHKLDVCTGRAAGLHDNGNTKPFGKNRGYGCTKRVIGSRNPAGGKTDSFSPVAATNHSNGNKRRRRYKT